MTSPPRCGPVTFHSLPYPPGTGSSRRAASPRDPRTRVRERIVIRVRHGRRRDAASSSTPPPHPPPAAAALSQPTTAREPRREREVVLDPSRVHIPRRRGASGVGLVKLVGRSTGHIAAASSPRTRRTSTSGGLFEFLHRRGRRAASHPPAHRRRRAAARRVRQPGVPGRGRVAEGRAAGGRGERRTTTPGSRSR